MSPPPDDYDKFVRSSAAEELHQHSPVPLAIGTDPTDGLPAQIAPRNFDKSPPLTEDTLVCMADKRSFVIRDKDGFVLQAFPPSVVQRLPNGGYFVLATLLDKDVRSHVSAGWTDVLSEIRIPETDQFVKVAAVEPIRPACGHYIRMQTDLAADREARYIVRACQAQRDETGEYYSVRDSLISACTLRTPRHYESEQLLDAFDTDKIAQAKIRQEQEEFDIESELEREAADAAGPKKGSLGVLS